jgi:hypothetical protein
VRFDALGASIREVEAGTVADVLRRDLGGLLVRSKPRRRYQDVLGLDVAGREAAWIGFDSGNGIVYVEGKGETTPELVASVRRNFPEHTAPRLDVCEDYNGPGAFEALQASIRAAALSGRGRGSVPDLGFTAFPDDPVKGRTWGNLKRGGVAYLRVYEAGKMPERAHWGADAVRVEGEFRPHSAAEKRAAASMSPLEVWGLSPWTRRVAESLTGVEVPRFEAPASVYTQSKTLLYLARTYRRFWTDQLADLGDWECIGREMAEVWRLDDEAAARQR